MQISIKVVVHFYMLICFVFFYLFTTVITMVLCNWIFFNQTFPIYFYFICLCCLLISLARVASELNMSAWCLLGKILYPFWILNSWQSLQKIICKLTFDELPQQSKHQMCLFGAMQIMPLFKIMSHAGWWTIAIGVNC